MSHAISAPPIDPVILAHRQAAGTDLLRAYLEILLENGFARYRVDEIRNTRNGDRIRYGFAGGEWRVQVIYPDGTRWTIKYDCRHPMPTMKQLMDTTTGGHVAGLEFDASLETVIRGEKEHRNG